jgi:hypothetical protein
MLTIKNARSVRAFTVRMFSNDDLINKDLAAQEKERF